MDLPDFPGGMNATLGEARSWIRDQVINAQGAKCPCCTQLAKQYRRKLNSGMARSLIQMYKAGGTTWFVDVTKVCLGGTREEGKLRYWGLVEEAEEKREDGGRAGWWRVTKEGEMFIRQQVTMPSHCLLYDNHFRGFSGAHVTIQDCLGKKFNLRELLEA
jgi:hypothetical protein